MNKPILYSFRRCPYAMRARMSLHYAGIAVEHREISLSNKPKHMLEVSPKGTVPVLILKNQVIDESLDIMLWALAQEDKDGWLDLDSTTSDQMFQLIHNNDRDFKTHLDRYKYPDRYDKADKIFHRAQAEKFLQKLEGQLEKQIFLFSDKICLADVAIFPFIRQFSKVECDWFTHSPYPHLKKWLQFFLESELFTAVMQKYPLYEEHQ